MISTRSKPTNYQKASSINGEARLKEQIRIRESKRFVAITPTIDNPTYKHSGDLGDVWYSLPAIRYLGKGCIYLNPNGLRNRKADGTPSGLNPRSIKMAIPLLEIQPYIQAVHEWHDEKIDIDLDSFRIVKGHYTSNLSEHILNSVGVSFDVCADPWISCNKNMVATTIFSRSPRYNHKGFSYSTIYDMYKSDAVFIGLPSEHDKFKRMYGNITYYPVKDFLEMAEVINGAELFIGNQSSPMAMAIGLGKSYIQEVCPYAPNCIFPRVNGQHIL